MTIKSELETIFGNNDLLSPHDVVAWGSSHKGSALYHELKCGDDAGAATLWRLDHARRLISIYIVDEDRERSTISLTMDRHDDGGYRRVDDVMSTPNLRYIALMDALRELQRIKSKFDGLGFDEFDPVFGAIDKVVADLRPGRRHRTGGASEGSHQYTSAA